MSIKAMGTIFFNCRNFGWSETYPIIAADLDAAQAELTIMFALRVSMCCQDVTVVGGRVSDTEVRGDSLLVDVSPTLGTFGVADSDKTYGAQDETIRTTFIDATRTKRAHRNLHGIPSSQFDSLGRLTILTAWGTLHSNWVSQVATQFAIATRRKPADRPPNYDFSAIDSSGPNFQSQKKVGRPFDLAVGRRTIR